MIRSFLCAFSLMMLAGCGNDKTIIPTTDLTEEQKKAVKLEDEKVFEEEGGTKQKGLKVKR